MFDYILDKLGEPRVRFFVNCFNYIIFLGAAYVIFTGVGFLKFLLIPLTFIVYMYDSHLSYKLGFEHGSGSADFMDQVMGSDAPQALFGDDDIVIHNTDPGDEFDPDNKKSS